MLEAIRFTIFHGEKTTITEKSLQFAIVYMGLIAIHRT